MLEDRDYPIKDGARVAIVVSNYYHDITFALKDSAKEVLLKHGVYEANIIVKEAPGAFELPYEAQQIAKRQDADVIIAFGLIIKGETPHFDFVGQGTTQGIMDVSLKFDTPVIFGLLTTDNMEQAKDRIAGGTRGDKGRECAYAALHLLCEEK